MNATDVIAYAYDADIHCIPCTLARYRAKQFAMTDPLGYGPGRDENGLPYAAADSEGNAVHPLFATEAEAPEFCGDCGEHIDGTPEEGETPEGEETVESAARAMVDRLLEDFGHTRPSRHGREIVHGYTSDCCGASVLSGGFCADCGDHCQAIDDETGEPIEDEPRREVHHPESWQKPKSTLDAWLTQDEHNVP